MTRALAPVPTASIIVLGEVSRAVTSTREPEVGAFVAVLKGDVSTVVRPREGIDLVFVFASAGVRGWLTLGSGLWTRVARETHT